eukprot:scaffold18414_cov92-Skeletonema_dohrnii-CCMP3373.AAC.3
MEAKTPSSGTYLNEDAVWAGGRFTLQSRFNTRSSLERVTPDTHCCHLCTSLQGALLSSQSLDSAVIAASAHTILYSLSIRKDDLEGSCRAKVAENHVATAVSAERST